MSTKKQLIVELVEKIVNNKISNPMKIFDDNAAEPGKKQCMPAEFKMSLERMSNSTMKKEDYIMLSKDYLTDDGKYVNYGIFLKELKVYIDAKVNLERLFDVISRKMQRDNVTLLDIFKSSDKDQTMRLSSDELQQKLGQLNIKLEKKEVENIVQIFDKDSSKEIEYNEFEDWFKKTATDKGINYKQLLKSQKFEDQEKITDYWALKIFQEIHEYFEGKKLDCYEFFKTFNMEDDRTISSYDFEEALLYINKNFDTDDIYKLGIELEDSNTHKISIKKFQSIYSKINESGMAGSDKNSKISGFSAENKKQLQDLLDNIRSRILKKFKNILEFFQQYEYDTFLKCVSKKQFLLALSDLKMYVSDKDRDLLQQFFDPKNTNNYDVTLLDIYEDSDDNNYKQKPVTALNDYTQEQEKNSELDYLIKDISKFIVKNNIEFEADLKKLDSYGDGYILHDELESYFKNKNLELSREDMELLIKEYDIRNNGNIQLKRLVGDLYSYINKQKNKGDDLNEALAQLYKSIREKHSTIEEFMRSIDIDKDQNLDKREFLKMFKELGIQIDSALTAEIYNYFDADKKGKIYFYQFRNGLKKYQEEDVKQILKKINAFTENKGTTFENMVSLTARNDQYITPLQLAECLDENNIQIKLRDIHFIIGFFEIEKSIKGEIDYVILSQCIKRFNEANGLVKKGALERKGTKEIYKKQNSNNIVQSSNEDLKQIQNKKLLKKLNEKLDLKTPAQIMKTFEAYDKNEDNFLSFVEFKGMLLNIDRTLDQSEIRKLFDMYDSNNDNKISIREFKDALNFDQRVNDNQQEKEIVGKSQWAKSLFQDIYEALAREETNFEKYFEVKQGQIDLYDFKLKLKEIEIGFTDDVQKLIKEYKVKGESNIINIKDMYIAYQNYTKGNTQINVEVEAKECINQVAQFLEQDEMTFEDLIESRDKYNDGKLKNEIVKDILIEQLKMKKNSQLNSLIEYFSDRKGFIEFQKFKEELWKTPVFKAIDIHESIEKLILCLKDRGATVKEAFDLYDKDMDSELNFNEFKTFVKRTMPNAASTLISLLFYTFDKNQNKKINFKEFSGLIKYDVQSGNYSNNNDNNKNSYKDINKKFRFAKEIFYEINNIIRQNKSPYIKAFGVEEKIVRVEYKELQRILQDQMEMNSKQQTTKITKLIDELKLYEQRKDSFNFETLLKCLKQFDDIQDRRLTSDELKQIQKMLLQIKKFMEENNITFSKLFNKYDTNETGYITRDSLDQALEDELYIESSPVLNLVYQYLSNGNDEISLKKLKEELYNEDNNNYSNNKDNKNNSKVIKVYTIEEVVDILLPDYQNDIERVIDSFDLNSNKEITKPEFIKRIEKQIPNIELDSLRKVFDNLDEEGEGVISVQFLRKKLLKQTKFNVKIKNLTDFINELKKLKQFKNNRALLTEFDENDNGKISKREFRSAVSRILLKISESDISSIYDKLDTDGDGYFMTDQLKKLLEGDTISDQNEEKPGTGSQKKQLLDKVSKFTQEKDKELIKYVKEFELSRLTTNQMRMTYSYVGLTLTKEDIEAICEEIDVIIDKKGTFDYQDYFTKIKKFKGASTNDINELDDLFRRISDDIKSKRLDFVRILKPYDALGNDMVDYRDIFDEFKKKDIQILKDEQNMILEYFKPNQKNQINYILLVKAIMYGKESVKSEIILSIVDQLAMKIKEEMEDSNETIDKYFRRNTSGNGDIMTIRDLKEVLDKMRIPYDDNNIHDIYARVDLDGDQRVSLGDFTRLIQGNIAVEVQELVTQLQNQMRKRKDTLDDIIEKYSKNSNSIIYSEFRNIMQDIDDKLQPQEIEALFRHFDTRRKDQINKQVLQEVFDMQHITQDKIKQFVNECIRYMRDKKWNINDLFNNFDRNKPTGQLSLGELRNMVNTLGLNYNQQEIQQIFNEMDEDGDAVVEYNEFHKFLSGFVSKKLNKIRQKIWQHVEQQQISLVIFMRQQNVSSNNRLNYQEFNDMLSNVLDIQILDDTEKKQLYQIFDDDNDNYIGYDDFHNIMLMEYQVDEPDLLHKFVEGILQKNLSGDELLNKFDKKNDGFLKYKDFIQMISYLKLNLTPEEKQILYRLCDSAENGKYNEKITVTKLQKIIDSNQGKTQDKIIEHEIMKETNEEMLLRSIIEYTRKNDMSIRVFFEMYDQDKDKHLNQKEFKELALKFNQKFSDGTIKEIFTKIDIDEDYQLNFYEFHKAITDFDEGVYNEVVEKIQQHLKAAELRAIVFFRQHDQDGDNFLSYNEFQNMIQTIKIQKTERQIRQVFNRFDTLKKSKISAKDFEDVISDSKQIDVVSILSKLQQTIKKEDILIERVFKQADKNGDGHLAFNEFRDCVDSMNLKLTIDEKEALFKYFDREKKGRLSYEDVLAVLNSRVPKAQVFSDMVKRFLCLSIKYIRNQKMDDGELIIQYNQDQDAGLNQNEFKKLLKGIGLKCNREELEEIFEFMDRDEIGIITSDNYENILDECFTLLCLKISERIKIYLNEKKKTEDDLFLTCDANQDELLSYKEFSNLLMNAKVEDLTDDEQGIVFNVLDADCDNQISIIDYRKMLNIKIGQDKYCAELIIVKIYANMNSTNNSVMDPLENFEIADKDQKGFIDSRKFYQVIKRIMPSLKDSEIRILLKYLDPDKTEKIYYQQIAQELANPSNELMINALKFLVNRDISNQGLLDTAYFSKIDQDRDGYLVQQEFANYLGYLKFNIDDKLIKKLFKALDNSNNKMISFEEFKQQLIGERADIQQFGWAVNIIENIDNSIKQRNQNFKDVFSTSDKNNNLLDKYEFKLRLKSIGIDYYNEDAGQFVDQLTLTDQPDLVDLSTLSYLLEHYTKLKTINTQKNLRKSSSRKNTNINQKKNNNNDNDNYQKNQQILQKYGRSIKKFLKEDQITFEETFESKDKKNKGYINLKVFQQVFYDDLGVTQSEQSDYFISLLHSENDDKINLGYLRQLIENDNPDGFLYEQQQQQQQDEDQEDNNNLKNKNKNKLKSSSSKQFKQQYSDEEQEQQSDEDIQYMNKNYKNDNNKVPNLKLGQKGQMKPNFKVLDNIEQMKKLIKDKNMTAKDVYQEIDKNNNDKVSKEEFVKYMSRFTKINVQEIEDVFEHIDSNKNKYLSENEFKLFLESTNVQQDKMNIRISKEMEDQIYELFRKIDKDNNGSLDRNEIAQSFQATGMNFSGNELQAIFDKYDKNGDGRISFEEFKIIFTEKIKKDILTADDIVKELREQFRKADIYHTGTLTPEQYQYCLANLGIELKDDELESLLVDVDKNFDGQIDIDEFIDFINKHAEGSNELSNNALLSIRKAKKFSITDLVESFNKMPQNFILSFLREENKRSENLPSETLKPKLDISGLFYSNLSSEDFDPVRQRSLPRYIKLETSRYAAEIIIENATGVPVPILQSNEISEVVVGRELKVCLFDKSINKFVGNTLIYKAVWNPTYEDRWGFNVLDTPNENSLYIKIGKNEKNLKEENLLLVFEFVIHYKKNNQDLEMSCAYCSLEIVNTNISKEYELNLQGGSPVSQRTIKQNDIRTTRTGWRYVVKKMSANIKSRLLVEVKHLSKLSKEKKESLEYLPPRIILKRNALPLYKIYREYCAKKLAEEKSLVLESDLYIKVFRRVIDCPDTSDKFINFYHNEIWPKYKKNKSPDQAIRALQVCLDEFYLLISSVDFDYSLSDPTEQKLCQSSFISKRERLVNQTLEKILSALGMTLDESKRSKEFIKGKEQIQDFKPFDIMELMEIEEDDAMLSKFLNKLKNRVTDTDRFKEL